MNQTLSMDQLFLCRLTEITQANLENEKFGVEELARELGMSRSSLHRKLKYVYKHPVSQFIREIRLQKAMEMLRQNTATASEIAFRVGFSSPSYFNKCFHEYYGYPPGDVKKRKTISPETNGNILLSETNPINSETESLSKEKRKSKRLNYRLLFYSIFIVLVLFSMLYLFGPTLFKNLTNTNRLKAGEKSIVVLPFKNLSDDPDNQYFADGVMEDILNHLFQIRDLRVVSRTSVEHLRGSLLTTPEIAKKLHVNYVLEGSVQKHEDKLRLIVQLIDARRDQHIWSEKYDRDHADIFSIESDIAKQIAFEMQAVLSTNEMVQINKIPTSNVEAYNLYLKGRFFARRLSEDGVKIAIEYYKEAIAIDPDFTLALVGLAEETLDLAFYGFSPWPEGLYKAKKIAARALELDEKLADVHALLSELALVEFKWEEARKESILAIKCNSNLASGYAHYASLLIKIGQKEEARKQLNRAKELDPLSFSILDLSAWLYFNEGQFDEEINELRKMEEIDSNYVHIYRRYSITYFRRGEFSKAVDALQKICLKDPNYRNYRNYSNDLMKAYKESGINGALNKMLELESKSNNPIYIAAYCLLTNRKKEALNWLEKACEVRYSMAESIPYAYPFFDSLRSEPRYWAIIKKMGLSEYYKYPDLPNDVQK